MAAATSATEPDAGLKERERHQAFLIDWSDKVRGEASPDAIMATTLEWLGRHLGVTRTTYSEGDIHGRLFSILGEWRDPEVISIANTSFSLDDVGDVVDREWMSGGIVCYGDITTDPRIAAETRPSYLGAQIVAFISVPLIENGKIRSALSVQHHAARPWRADEILLLREIAERTWVSLERARAEAALKAREQSQAFLIDWSDSVRDEIDPDAILATTLDQIGRKLDVSRANYCQLTPAGDAFHIPQEWQDGVVSVIGQTFPLSVFGEAILADHMAGAPVFSNDTAEDPRIGDHNRAIYETVGARAWLSMPLVRGGAIMAILSVQQTTPRRWTASEIDLLRDVADRTWAVLERAYSERRLAQNEALLTAFMENAPVVMHLKDGDGRYLRVNPEFSRAVGLPREAIEGQLPDALFPPGLVADIEAIERRALAGETASAEMQISREGPYATVLSTVFPIPGDGGPAKTAGVTIDLSERKRVEQALASSRESLFQTEKLSALGSLLAGVSHELNNPLSIVVAQAVMMERQAQGSELAERAQKIRKAADRCARIVQTFLAMARQKRPERAAVDLNAVVSAGIELADYGLRADGIETVLDLAPGLPQISADSDQLHQIILNLIVNAQQAMVEAGGAGRRLTLRTRPAEAAGMVALDVVDTGPGVPDETRRRIFEPFFTTKPQGQGTGVGLSFSLGLAEAHGGRLELLPTDEGACFRLSLPINADPAAEAPPEPIRLPSGARWRALIVDDEPEIAESLADFLSLEGFACQIAVGGAAAQRALSDGIFDCVVSDLRMPGVDGRQLYAWIAAKRPELLGRVGFATGDTLGAAAAQFLADVKRPVLEKPFMPDAVRRFVQQLNLA